MFFCKFFLCVKSKQVTMEWRRENKALLKKARCPNALLGDEIPIALSRNTARGDDDVPFVTLKIFALVTVIS